LSSQKVTEVEDPKNIVMIYDILIKDILLDLKINTKTSSL